MTYSEKLRDPRWQKKRLEILNRDSFTCTLCGDKKTTLHIHHLKYNGNPWQANNEDLSTHCEHCHKIVECFKDWDYKVVVVSKGSYQNSKNIALEIIVFRSKHKYLCFGKIDPNGDLEIHLMISEEGFKSTLDFYNKY